MVCCGSIWPQVKSSGYYRLRVERRWAAGSPRAASADKTRIGFVVVDGERFNRSSIMVMNRDGSGVRELLTKTRRPGAVPFFAAVPLLLGESNPDGAAILFAATDVLPNGFTKWDTDLSHPCRSKP